MRALGCIMILMALQACALPQAMPEQTVRQKFVPGEGCTSCGNASWTDLGPHPDDPSLLWMHAWAGVGHQFPVQSEPAKAIFIVAMIDGGDDALLLDVRADDGNQRLTIRRDVPVHITLPQGRFEIHYPSVTVRAGDSPTTSKAMLSISTRQ